MLARDMAPGIGDISVFLLRWLYLGAGDVWVMSRTRGQGVFVFVADGADKDSADNRMRGGGDAAIKMPPSR